MKKLIVVLALLSSGSAFATCPNSSKTVFQCTTNNNKVVQVCDAGKTIKYAFGKTNASPELTLSVPRNKVTTYQWDGIGRYINYTVNIPNGKTIYQVSHSLDKHTQEESAGISVTSNGKSLAEIPCNLNKKIINRMEGINLPPDV